MSKRAAALAAVLALTSSAAASPGDPGQFCADLQKPFFRSLPDGSGEMAPARGWTHVERFRMPKTAGTFRAFVVGESVAYYFEPEKLAQALARFLPAKGPVEVVNAGVPSYDSAMIAPVVEEVLGDQADLVVVFSGNNEVYRGEECPGLQKSVADRLRVAGLLKSSLLGDLRLFDPIYFTRRAGRLLLYEANLRRMVRAARARGVPIVLATLPVDLVDYAPWGSAAFGDPAFDAAWLAMGRGAWAEAAPLFGDYVRRFPREPSSRFFLAECLRRLGRNREALENYQEAVEWDPVGDRATRARNGIVRAVAAEEGAAVAELDSAFSRAAPDGLIGGRLILDGVHWPAPLNGLVALEIVRALSATPLLAGPGFDRAGLEREIGRAVASAGREPENWRVLFSVALAHLDRWSVENADGEILENGILFLRRVDDAGAAARMTLRLSSHASLFHMLPKSAWVPDLGLHFARWFPLYLEHLGELRRRRGRAAEALPLFDQAILLAPGRPLIRLFRALARAAAGDPAGARADVDALPSSLRGDPRWADLIAKAFPLEKKAPNAPRP